MEYTSTLCFVCTSVSVGAPVVSSSHLKIKNKQKLIVIKKLDRRKRKKKEKRKGKEKRKKERKKKRNKKKRKKKGPNSRPIPP